MQVNMDAKMVVHGIEEPINGDEKQIRNEMR